MPYRSPMYPKLPTCSFLSFNEHHNISERSMRKRVSQSAVCMALVAPSIHSFSRQAARGSKPGLPQNSV